jgi:hypothetical protein
MHFPTSNNAAKYEALLHDLGDSLFINWANKEWSCLDDKIMLYCQELCKLENNFDGLEYLHIL